MTVMNPRTHPRGAAPSFTLPKPNPNPKRITDALWWLVCMRELLEPASENGGTYGNKPGSHNIGDDLPDYGPGDRRTDHSIRDPANRRGPWWREYCAAHDWTFPDAQRGHYTTINRYTKRQIAAMRDVNDPRPDDVYFYVLGQADGDAAIEGWNERDDDPETSSDSTHTWHIHDSFWRDHVGNFWAMWAVLTIDMGWTVAEWRQSLEDEMQLTDPLHWNDKGAVKYSKPTTTVGGALVSTNYYVLQGRDAILAEHRKAALRDAAILAAVQGVDEEAVLAAVNGRADQHDAQLAALTAAVQQLPAAVATELDGSADAATVQDAVERALHKLQLTVTS